VIRNLVRSVFVYDNGKRNPLVYQSNSFTEGVAPDSGKARVPGPLHA
jgi:hypothetical protein